MLSPRALLLAAIALEAMTAASFLPCPIRNRPHVQFLGYRGGTCWRKQQIINTIHPLSFLHREDSEDDQRLLLTVPAIGAYVEAEVHAFLLDPILHPSEADEEAVTTIAAAAREAYVAASKADVLSHHGALISFISTELRGVSPGLSAHLRRMRTNPYVVSKLCVDMLHHRLFRGTYTKTATPTGAGEAAARAAVGLPPLTLGDEEDECLVEPPPELRDAIADCLWRESDDAAWRDRRFEKITMEGWRDPRRGNSGTSR